jgi:hypothetical protein
MAHHRLGQSDEARQCLEKGVRWESVARAWPVWHLRLRYELTRREAEALLGQKSSGAQIR